MIGALVKPTTCFSCRKVILKSNYLILKSYVIFVINEKNILKFISFLYF